MNYVVPSVLRLTAVYALTLFLIGPVHARDDAIQVSDAWARATVGESRITAVYMDIRNRSMTPDKLLSITTPLANSAQVHESLAQGDVMEMQPVDSLTIKPGELWEAKPGGYHVMVMGLHLPLKVGDTLPLVLHFENSGNIPVNAAVLPLGSRRPK